MWVLSNDLFEFFSIVDALSEMLLEPFNAITSQNEPKLDRSKSSSKSDLPIPVIDHSTGITMFRPQERRCNVQC